MAEQEYDLIVVGSGAGALLGAIRAQEQGLKTLVVEKSALSGGGIWIPVNYDQQNAGVKDDLETAFSYMKRCVRGMASDDRVLAYVETANKMAEYLRQIGIPYRAMAKYADYYPHIEGSRPGGRTMDPVDFNAARLGLAALGTPTGSTPSVCRVSSTARSSTMALVGFDGTAVSPRACLTGVVDCAAQTAAAALSAKAMPVRVAQRRAAPACFPLFMQTSL